MNNSNLQEPSPSPELPQPGKAMLLLGFLLKVWRRIENLAFALVLFFIALYFTLQSTPVQNWLISKVSTYLSEELHTTVRVGHVDIAFFDRVLLEQVYIADLQGDTLIYAGQISAGVNGNFFSALNNKLEFTEIQLSHARCYLRRPEGSHEFNYEFLVNYFSGNGPKKPNKKKTPFVVKVRNFKINDVLFIQDNVVNGQKMRMQLPKAVVQINLLDIPSKKADIEYILLQNLYFDYEEHEKKPVLPKASQAVATPDTASAKKIAQPFIFHIRHFRMEGGVAEVDRFRASPVRTLPDNIMDFNHLLLQGLTLNADSIRFSSDMAMSAQISHLALAEQCGFAINHASAQKMVLDTNITALYGFDLQTNNSHIGDTLLFKYDKISDFKRFNTDIYLEAHLKEGSLIHVYDLAYFHKSLPENSLLKRNKDLDIQISGLVKGKVNRLDGRNIVAKVGNSTYLAFDFDGDDLAKGKDVMRMEFDFERLQTDLPALRKMLPLGKIPSNIEKLGAISYSGSYNMFFGTNHVLQGKIKSNLGGGNLDVNLDMTGGLQKATYSGRLAVQQFDLGTISGNKDLGKTSFNVSILPGSRGLTKHSMKANVKGRVDTLVYKGYHYKALVVDGTVSESLFEGTMGIKDPNIDFSFVGKVNLKDSIPIYVFNADIHKIDLGRLNLTKQDLVVSAKVDNVRLTGDNLADLSGVASVYNLEIIQTTNDEVFRHQIDSIRFESNYQAQNFRHFALRSDFLAANIDGNFTLSKAPRNFLQLISKYYPKLAGRLHFPAYDSTEITDLYRFGFFINNTKNLTKLVDRQLDTIRNVSIGGQVDGRNGISEMYAHVPSVRYRGKELSNIIFNWRSERNKAFMKVNLPQIKLSQKYIISEINVTAKLKDDVALLDLVSESPGSGVKSVNLKGELSAPDSLWQIKLLDSKFDLFGLKWAVEKDNYIRFGPGYIDIKNLELANGLRRIILEGRNNGRGLNLITSNFDLNFINEILPTRGLSYRGTLSDFGITVEDVFKLEGIEVGLATDTVFVNNKPYGRVDGSLSLIDLKHPLEWSIASRDKKFNLTTTGAWMFSGNTAASVYAPDVLKPNDLYSRVTANNFPMNILQQFIPGISKTEGQFDLETIVDGRIKGSSTAIGLDGYGIIREGGFVIDYLNTPFYIKNQKVILTDDRIWADKDTIYDATKKNMAFIKGGLRHNLFKKWKIECEVRSDNNNFVLMDTKKVNNPVYYGKGIGTFIANFGGTFSKTDIRIDATTGPNTKLFIPITTETEAKEANFIKFKSKNKEPIPVNPIPIATKRIFTATDLKGLSIDMNLTLTQQAEMQIIFDEQAGDIIKGWGNGDIAIEIKRDGEFKMFGNYTFDRGEYLFTLPTLAINKPFKMQRGGNIAWYGDPYHALIDIKAVYRENAPLANLLQDELAIVGAGTGTSQSLLSQANNSSPVDLVMYLAEDLFKPTITFELEFPNISPLLKSYVENKMRLLEQDQNEINRQVFGLLIFGMFLPPDSFAPQSLEAQISTVTQFMSSQLSRYMSSLAIELLGSSVSNFDIDIDYQNNNVLFPGATSATEGRDLMVRMRSSFADERITVQVGSQFGLGSSQNSGSVYNNTGFQGEDVVIEFQPMENKQWKVRVYQRTEPNLSDIGSTLRNSFGMGITFSKDFNNYAEMMSGIKKWVKK